MKWRIERVFTCFFGVCNEVCFTFERELKVGKEKVCKWKYFRMWKFHEQVAYSHPPRSALSSFKMGGLHLTFLDYFTFLDNI